MENLLFSLKSTFDTWLNSSSPFWAIDTILAFLCGLGLFLLILPYLENNPSFAPPRKHENIRKHPKERRGRSRSSKRNGALKACRDCLEALEEVWDLTSLLQRHLGRFPDKGSFHQSSCQDSPGEVCKAVPAGAHTPCREEAAPTISPALLTKQPLPWASAISPGSVSTYSESYLSASPTPEPFFPLDSLSPWPLAGSPSPPSPSLGRACPPPPAPCSTPTPSGSMLSLTQGDSTTRTLGTIPHRSSPHSSWRPAIPGLVHSSSSGSALAWWQEAATAWSFSTSTHLESQKESLPLYPPEASFWGDPRNRQVEAGGLAFINPNVQELLEILITKRVELKSWKEKEKDEEAGYHLNSLGKRIESLGHKQDSLGHQHFWNITGKHDQLLGPEKPRCPDTLGGCLQKTCSQLFWGLPFLHSESLVAAVTVPGSALELCPVLFNERSRAKPFHIPAKVASQLSLAKHLTQPMAQAQPQSLTPTIPQYHPQPQAQLETTVHLSPSPLVQSSSSQCQIGTEKSFETSCPTVPNKASSFSSNAIENLERHFWKKQLESRRTLPSLAKNSRQVFSQVTLNPSQETRSPQAHTSVPILPGHLISPEVRKKLEHHIYQRFVQQQSGLPCRIQASQKLMQPQDQYPRPCQAQGREGPSRSSAGRGKRSQDAQKMRSKCPAQILPGTDLCRDIGQSVGKIVKDLYMFPANPPVKDPRAKPASEIELSLDRKQPEVSRVLTERKAEQICESESPVNVYHLRLVDNLVLGTLGETNAPMKTESTQSAQDGRASMITSHESLVLSPYTEQELEAHIIRFRVRHRWSLLFKVLKFIFRLKLKKVQVPTLKVTCESGYHSTALLTKGLGKPPQPHAGEKLKTTEAVPPLERPRPVPSPVTEEARGALGGRTPGDTHKPPEASLTGQEDKPPPQAPTCSFVGRMWHSMSVLDECAPSSRAQEVVEGGSAGKGTREPSVQVKYLDINIHLGTSRPPRSSESPSLNTTSAASNTEDLLFETQSRKLESQGFTDQQAQAQGRAPSVLLQDYCHSNMLLAANILASQESLSYFQILSRGDKCNSQKLYDATSSEGSSPGQQVDMRRQLKYKSRCKESVPKDGREKYRRPKLRQIKKGLAERRAYQAQGMSHPGQKKESTESLRSKFRQLVLKKRQVPSESHFKETMKLLLQWIFPSKGREPEEPLQKESIKSKSTMDSRAVEAQTIMTAVGQIVKEMMVFHQGPHATELNWYQAEFQDPRRPHYCHHRILSYQEERRMRRDTPPYHQATTTGHTFSKKRKWTSPRDSRWAFSPREPGPPPGRVCQHGSRVTWVPGHSLHCPRHGLPQKYTCSYSPVRISQHSG
ncbi:hypothetical protein FD754_023565 [Muntiacus muntjak]|uniref:Uncharacterized protein n=1 Tax=Muntiacus muntjak TaxID=9888 RepID=A0A5N3USZ7_MUNMU|nr:hypothetical protein FD754_023566 [Muntiacus muntjak]KAB0339896.1 hypothetical protein FD754_023565 [Muntiacus muntjak]